MAPFPLDREAGIAASQEAERPAAARNRTLAVEDRAAYLRIPEMPDDFWDDAEAWSDE